MKGLESYPSSNLNANEEEYSHVKEILGSNKQKSVGTLSKSEWEATSKLFYIFY